MRRIRRRPARPKRGLPGWAERRIRDREAAAEERQHEKTAIVMGFESDEERDRTMRAKPHCPECGCDLHEDGTCPEGCRFEAE